MKRNFVGLVLILLALVVIPVQAQDDPCRTNQ